MVEGEDGRLEVEGVVRLEGSKTKNKTAKNLHLDSELKELIQDLWDTRKLGCPYVFHWDGEQIKYFKNSWQTACKDAKLGKRLFHDFRRTAVRNMVRAGIPERVAMMVSGHKTRSIFDRYNITNEADLEMAASRLEAHLENQGVTGSGDNVVTMRAPSEK